MQYHLITGALHFPCCIQRREKNKDCLHIQPSHLNTSYFSFQIPLFPLFSQQSNFLMFSSQQTLSSPLNLKEKKNPSLASYISQISFHQVIPRKSFIYLFILQQLPVLLIVSLTVNLLHRKSVHIKKKKRLLPI